MKEVIRLKKLEEKREIDNQLNQGLLLVGSPDIKKNRIDIAYGDSTVRNELSDIANQIGGTSARGGSILRSSKDSSGMSPSRLATKVRTEDIEKLEKKCQRMIFEKEDKFLENEHKLKDEDQQL